jgi:hypothetical protein
MSRWIPRIPASTSGTPGPPGPPGDDRFAPKYLVGNIPNGDTAPALALLGFFYFPDPGDGSGIAAALAAANPLFGGIPGDVWIRPGTYDFNLGAVVAPLAIPASVRVYGSGNTTAIIGRTTGDQGIFTMASLSQLRDLRMLVLASDAGSLGSDAMVHVIGEGAILQNLQFVLTTATDGQLREGIRFDTTFTALASDMLNVGVSIATLTGGASPTRGIALFNNAFTFARHVQTLGGDEAIFSSSSIFVCKDLLALNWSLFGIRHVGNGGAVRIDESISQSDGVSVGGYCVSLEGQGGHVLRSMSCQNNGSAGSRGVSVVAPGVGDFIFTVEIDDCEAINVARGFQLGDPDAGYVTDISVVNCTVTGAVEYGIVIGNALSSLCHLKGNTVRTSVPTAVFGGNIWAQGFRHDIDGNHVVHASADQNSQAVLLECLRTTFHGNTVEFSDTLGLVGTDKRLAIVGNEFTALGQGTTGTIHLKDQSVHSTVGDNTIECLLKGVGAPAIRIDSDFCTVGDNTIEVTEQTPAAPGIIISGDYNTCVGNVVEGSPAGVGTPVLDAGLGNEIAHNVGV